MRFYSRKWIRPADLNSHGSLFGGQLLQWIDEEAAIFAMCQLNNNPNIVTKYISEINFTASARTGDIVEMGMEVVAFGRTSITLSCEVRNKVTKEKIITIDRIVFVSLDANGRPSPHGCTEERD
ncbi:acyl-CoA thioesterase [Ruficoccus amylovorans]|uniref:Acyl-CoA thioesterase n=1 Tax=Ruficoccus amylovorans TaxID=1804625 RepID=A0A842HAS0_9BACT|nr:hotdog domain-containing protein [Ruficoccus amylovorans]MBC2593380.1 acyl-CoA thioesterase [Ruficoccus amylovorans]